MYKITRTDIEKLKMKDESTFDKIWKAYANVLVFFIMESFNISQFDAEEITEQSLIYATYEKIDQYDSNKCQFNTWLFAIAKNKAIDFIKNKKKIIDVESADCLHKYEDVNINNTVLFDDLKKILTELEYQCIMQHVILGYSVKDLSKTMNKRISYIKLVLNNAYRKIRNYFLEANK